MVLAILTLAVLQAVPLGSCSSQDTVFFLGSHLQDREQWYGEALRRMGEPRLCPRSNQFSFRLLWLRSFHRPVSVRIARTGSRTIVTVAMLDRPVGHGAQRLAQHRSFTLDQKEWNGLLELVDRARFWQLPTTEPDLQVIATNGERLYGSHADGAQWILEAANDTSYHVIDRWSPRFDEDQSFYQLCRYVLELSRLKLHVEEIY